MELTRMRLGGLSLAAALMCGVTFAGSALAQSEQKIETASSESCTNPSPNHASLSGMVVGFSQSENEQNPFRAGETNSVKEAAAKVGAKLLYTNANDMGSDFLKQGQRAADVLAQVTGGKAKVIEIQGAYGNGVETARTDGFAQGIAKHPGIKLLAAQTGNWSTTDAQRVMEQLLLAHHNVTAVYAQADVMALGAMTALKQGGKTPGKNVKIVSIDGTKALVQQLADGNVNAIVETNPRFGPQAFDALTKWFAGTPVPQKIIMSDFLYTKANASEQLSKGAPY